MKDLLSRLQMAWHVLRGDSVIAHADVTFVDEHTIRVDSHWGDLWLWETRLGWLKKGVPSFQVRAPSYIRVATEAPIDPNSLPAVPTLTITTPSTR